LDEVGLNKEVTSWPGVTIQNKKNDVSYVMLTISKRSTPLETLNVGPSMSNRTQKPTNSKDELEESKEEVFPSDTLHIVFSSILDDATISGKKL
jgi:hypothetical protein